MKIFLATLKENHFILFCAIFISSCAHHLRPWHSKAHELEPFKYPFLAHYNKKEKELIFAAVNHVTKDNNSTTDTIDFAIKNYRPEIVLVEGVDFDFGISPKKYINFAKTCAKSNFNECIEPYFAIYLASKNNIPFYGADISDADILRFIKTKGYSTKDFLVFMVLRMIPQWQKAGKIANHGLDIEISQMLLKLSKELNIVPSLSLDEFYQWYQIKSGLNKINIDNLSEEISPKNNIKSSYFQKLSYIINMERDRFIARLISKVFLTYNKVLIVYGGSHHFVLQPFLEHIMGKAVFSKPF